MKLYDEKPRFILFMLGNTGIKYFSIPHFIYMCYMGADILNLLTISKIFPQSAHTVVPIKAAVGIAHESDLLCILLPWILSFRINHVSYVRKFHAFSETKS